MICSHYNVYALNDKNERLAYAEVYSFDEAYYNIDNWRDKYPTAQRFIIEYPMKEYWKEMEKYG